MGYSTIDIIYKAINIGDRSKNIIKSISYKNKKTPVMILISSLLCEQIDIRIKYYNELESEINNREIEEIDIGTYDKLSSLINEFNNKVYILEIDNVHDYLKFSLDLIKDTCSLFIDIQGRLANTNGINTYTYEILSKIITNINKDIYTIEKTIV